MLILKKIFGNISTALSKQYPLLGSNDFEFVKGKTKISVPALSEFNFAVIKNMLGKEHCILLD